jgi:DNA ligase-1
MQHFSHLFQRLDQTNSTNEKVAALEHFFTEANTKDQLWGLALLSGRKPKRTVTTALLRTWAAEISGIPDWLFEESYHTVGDLAETISLLVDGNPSGNQKTLTEWMADLAQLSKATDDVKRQTITNAWLEMDPQQRFLFNKLITGGFRVGVSQKLVEKALSKVHNIPAEVLAHRLMGNWSPETTTIEQLLYQKVTSEDLSKPYPFFLAHPLQDEPSSLGACSDWLAEWKWDGIRSQIIVRGKEIFIWSRGEELVTDKFPELAPMVEILPDGTVLDAELVVWKEGKVQPFQLLQTRISRKNVSKKQLAEAPAGLIVYDLFEFEGQDYRGESLINRREKLEIIIKELNFPFVVISDEVKFNSWEELTEIRLRSREMSAEGLMLKKRSSMYQVGRKRGDWWKWKVDPMTVDAVLIYAMQGHGRRANLFTDYTFAVWKNGALVPFTKAYSGLTDAEIKEVDAFVKSNTIEKFGPVRSVKAELVFEIGFEGIQYSSRHKSGVALRFPRMLRWRKDKPASEADQLETLIQLIETGR